MTTKAAMATLGYVMAKQKVSDTGNNGVKVKLQLPDGDGYAVLTYQIDSKGDMQIEFKRLNSNGFLDGEPQQLLRNKFNQKGVP